MSFTQWCYERGPKSSPMHVAKEEDEEEAVKRAIKESGIFFS